MFYKSFFIAEIVKSLSHSRSKSLRLSNMAHIPKLDKAKRHINSSLSAVELALNKEGERCAVAAL